MGWFSDALFGKKKRMDKNKMNDFMAPYTEMLGEQEDIARQMMDPNSAINRQQQMMMRRNQMDLTSVQNQGLLSTAAMGGVSQGQAAMQAGSNFNTSRAQMGQQYAGMMQNQFGQGLGLLGNVMSGVKGEGERQADMYMQEINAANAARQQNMQMATQLAGAAMSMGGSVLAG